MKTLKDNVFFVLFFWLAEIVFILCETFFLLLFPKTLNFECVFWAKRYRKLKLWEIFKLYSIDFLKSLIFFCRKKEGRRNNYAKYRTMSFYTIYFSNVKQICSRKWRSICDTDVQMSWFFKKIVTQVEEVV